MGRYVTRKRARFKSILGIDVNIPWGAVLEEQDGLLFFQGAPVCTTTSQDAYDFFSQDNDSQGEVRGRLVGSIMARLERRDANYQARWNKVWGSNSTMPPSAIFSTSLRWSALEGGDSDDYN